MSERVQLQVPGQDASLGVIRYGTWGRPLLAFPSESGCAEDVADNGMIAAVQDLIDAGRVSVFAVDTADGWTWSDYSKSTEDRAQGQALYQRWLVESVVPYIFDQMGGTQELVTTGVSMGGYHAVQLTLTRPDLAPVAIGLSGSYNPATWHAWGDMGEATYLANPTAYVPGMWGDHLDWVRQHANVVLVVGQGPFEVSPTQSLPSSIELARLLSDKGIRNELDIWGWDSAHDWPWWQRQLAHHLPRFC